MHPKSHPLLRNGNILELIIQSPFWVISYATGLVFFLEIVAWIVYGLGWHYHPKTYPLPHSMFIDFIAELMRWIRTESDWSSTKKYFWLLFLGLGSIILFPVIFIYYVKLLFWIWLGEPIEKFQNLFSSLVSILS